MGRSLAGVPRLVAGAETTGTQGRTGARVTTPSRRRTLLTGLAVSVVAFVLYWLSNRLFNAGRGDLFYLADAFLHGRTWIDVVLGPNDVIYQGGHVYVPVS